MKRQRIKATKRLAKMKSDDPIKSDATLMARIADEDMTAYRILCDRHMDRAYSLACHLLGNSLHADDIVQDAFLKLWKIAPKWEAKAQTGTWLHRVVHNLCIDQLRKQKKYYDGEMPDIEDPSPSPLQRREDKQVQHMITDGIQQLPIRQRIALTLVHYDECSNIEAAQRMDISVDALESLLSRGRRKLRDILAPRFAKQNGGRQ